MDLDKAKVVEEIESANPDQLKAALIALTGQDMMIDRIISDVLKRTHTESNQEAKL